MEMGVVMEQTEQARQLREIERHVAKGKRHIARQREMVAELEGDGHDTVPARRLLKTLENSQRQHLYACETMRRDLALGWEPFRAASASSLVTAEAGRRKSAVS
jgi:hypothetical protein